MEDSERRTQCESRKRSVAELIGRGRSTREEVRQCSVVGAENTSTTVESTKTEEYVDPSPALYAIAKSSAEPESGARHSHIDVSDDTREISMGVTRL